MLLYNHQKDFIGIDDADLSKLGLSSFTQLRGEAADFADLFVKTPGYIHNFKHVHWIDFIECAESNDTANVIIYVNKQSFKCSIDIKTIFLIEAPTKKAYLIYLNNLRVLTKDEIAEIANDIHERTIPAPAPQTPTSAPQFESPLQESLEEEVETEVTVDETPMAKVEHDLYEQDDFSSIDVFDTPPLITEDAPVELDFEDEVEEEPIKPEEKPLVQKNDFELDLKDIDSVEDIAEDIPYESDYVYDPSIASQELGLPLDLIEEFMGDFIAQAMEFKEQLYTAHSQGDTDKVKALSHKLKGVAANLRIEDAFEVLSIINTSDDVNEIKNNLNILYKIVAKLSSNGDAGIPPVQETLEEEAPTPIEPLAEQPQEEEIGLLVEESQKSEPESETISLDLEDEIFLDEPIETKEDLTTEQDVEPAQEILDIKEDELSIEEDILEEPEIKLDFNEEELLEVDDMQPEIPKIDDIQQDSLVIDYDKNSVANKLGLDIESFNELFDDYVNESKVTLNNIADAIEQDNLSLWKRQASRLKGMSNNMRIDALSSELDILANTDDINTAKEALDKLQISLEKISSL